jgi:2-oxoglutarate ferredoxin oxidoreductase subunit alpha
LRKDLGVKTLHVRTKFLEYVPQLVLHLLATSPLHLLPGPGFSLKTEALGLAMITELPLVVVDVQRSGPSTGIPTKTEQTDLNQALYGRNGECPIAVMAAHSPSHCFEAAFYAGKICYGTHDASKFFLQKGSSVTDQNHGRFRQ